MMRDSDLYSCDPLDRVAYTLGVPISDLRGLRLVCRDCNGVSVYHVRQRVGDHERTWVLTWNPREDLPDVEGVL